MKRSSQYFSATGGMLGTPTTIKTLRDSSSAGLDLAQLDATWTYSGALTTDTYKTMVTITGAGALHFVALKTVDAIARTIGLRITLDGGTPIEYVDAVNATTQGIVGVGFCPDAGDVPTFQVVPFQTSCLIEIKSSLTETNKIQLATAYVARA